MANDAFLKVHVANEGMEAVPEFYSSCEKNDTPNHRVAGFILSLVGSTIVFLMKVGASLEKGFLPLRRRVF